MISVRNVTKKYHSVKALKNVSFTINSGEYVALIGNNGSGKTTMIHILCNLIKYTGEVYLFGKLLDKRYHSYKKQSGIILSKPYYVEEFSANEYLNFVCTLQKVPKKEIKTRIEGITDFLEISNLKKAISKLSSGNQMKINLAASLIHNPKLLIYDEPFVNLDINTIEKFRTILMSLKRDKTLFITSHNLDFVVDICDRFLVFNEGKLLLDINKTAFDNDEKLKKYLKKTILLKS